MHSLNAASISRQWESSPIYSMPNPNILSSSTTIISASSKGYNLYILYADFYKNLPSEVISHSPTGYTPTTNCCDDYAFTESHGLYWLVMEKLLSTATTFSGTKLPSSRTCDVSDELMESVLQLRTLLSELEMNLHSSNRRL